jgi:hypothetical protein
LLYRDSELEEFVEMEGSGHRLTALRQAIQEGRLISGLTWEFDQKSAWEIFTDQRYARYFSASQRDLFRTHLLWTRLVREEAVTDPAGRTVDLPDFIRRHRSRLVLKPNTMFGGEGVVLGCTVSQRDWERHLHTALQGMRPHGGHAPRRARERYVVQQLARIPTDVFPMVLDGGVRFAERCVVSGFFFNSSGVGLVGRFSGLPVVAYDVGGIDEVVRHGQTGLLVPAGDEPALLAAVVRLASDRGLRDAMGAAARTACRAFEIGRIAAQYAEVYAGVRNGRGAHP